MSNVIIALFVALGATTLWFLWAWRRLALKGRHMEVDAAEKKHTWYHSVVGFVMCFFDTLGIGNFATTTSAFKFRASVPDEKIPGTLNVGYALPTVAQAYIYISGVKVDVWTLVLMIGAAVLGAWLGAGVVARWPRRKIQIGMGFALIAAALLMLRAQFTGQADDQGTLALGGTLLGLGLFGNFVLGALMTLGIGLYAPCLILVSLLGMNPLAAFPIMMGSCAFLMPVGGIKFIRAGSYSWWTTVTLALSGIPAVLIAAFIVKSLPLFYVRWLVVVVVVYAAVMMLRSAWKEKAPARRELGPEPAAD
jgi:uncharacterized membrane protein YfcA